MQDDGFIGCTKDRYASDLPELRAELQYCISNGQFGPRTGVALRWALEIITELALRQQTLALPDGEGSEL